MDPDRHAFRDGGSVLSSEFPERKTAPKRGPLDEEMVEDADSRHEQFVEEADRWHADKPS